MPTGAALVLAAALGLGIYGGAIVVKDTVKVVKKTVHAVKVVGKKLVGK